MEGVPLSRLIYLAVLALLLLIVWRGWFKGLRRKPGARKPSAASARDLLPGLLDKIEQENDLVAIPKAFALSFQCSDPALKLRAARAIAKRISLLPVTRLARLDSQFREWAPMEWDDGWRRADPAALLSPSLTEAEKTVILGLASFHPNGYFREKAVWSLSRMTTGAEFPYLIIRLNDWVVPVWNLANRAVRGRLTPQNARTIVNALPLIVRLRGRSRRDHHDLVRAAIGILSTPEARPELELGLRSKESMVRRHCYQAIAETGIFKNSALLGYVLKDPSPMNRAIVFRQLSANLTLEEVRSRREALLGDRSAPVRLITLRMLHRFDPAGSVPDLERAIMDDDPAVRDAARFLLRDHDGRYDFPSIYREALASSSARLPGAIAGLGETGQAADARSIIPFLKADRVRWARAGLRAYAKLDFAKAKGALIDLLADPRPGVVKEARSLLQKGVNSIDAADAGLIHRAFNKDEPAARRRRVAALLCSLNKWDALPYILEVSADPDETIARIGREALARWLSRYNRSFTAPSRTQLEAIQSAVKDYGPAIPEQAREQIAFNLKTL